MKETNELVEAAKAQQKYGCNNLTASDIAKYNWLPSLEFPGCFQNGNYLLYTLIDKDNNYSKASKYGERDIRKDHYIIKFVQSETLKEEILYLGKIDSIENFKELLGRKFLDIQDFWDSEERLKELQICNRMELLYKMKYE